MMKKLTVKITAILQRRLERNASNAKTTTKGQWHT